jgi:hypothetical protein
MTVIQIVLISAMGGSLLTTGALIALDNKSKKWEEFSTSQTEVINNLSTLQSEIQKGELEIQKSLTAPDLLEIPCSSEYMANNGEGLCREMFCRLQTREGDGASQSECEEIANLNNTISIIETCKANEMEIDKCLKVLDTRK